MQVWNSRLLEHRWLLRGSLACEPKARGEGSNAKQSRLNAGNIG